MITPVTGIRLSGDVTSDGISAAEEYERVEADPLAGIGQFTGIQQMDVALKGAKRGELWTHAAFTGGLKSTLALNWVYNQAVYRHSSVFFSLEMPYAQVRKILYAMHSGHEKFAEVRKALGIGDSLDYSRIRDGELDLVSDVDLALMSDAQKANLVEEVRAGASREDVLPRLRDSGPE